MSPERQDADPAAQVNPQVFVVEDAEVLVPALEQFEAVVVEGGGMYPFTAAQQLAHALAHLDCGIPGVGEGKYLVGLSMTFADQTLNPVD